MSRENIKHGPFTLYVKVFFPLSLLTLLPNWTVYLSNTRWVSYKKLTPGFFGGICVPHTFSFLYCLIMCLYVLSSLLWWLLRLPQRKDVRFISTQLVCLIDVICVCDKGKKMVSSQTSLLMFSKLAINTTLQKIWRNSYVNVLYLYFIFVCSTEYEKVGREHQHSSSVLILPQIQSYYN